MPFTGTPVDSVQRAAQKSAVKNEHYMNSPMHYAYFSYTHTAGAGTGEINLVNLPAGNIMIWPALCRVKSSAMVSTADLHIGHRAYTQPDGTVVAENDNEFLDNGDATSAIDSAFLLPAVPTVYKSKDGIEVYAMVNTADIENTDTITGYVAYTKN